MEYAQNNAGSKARNDVSEICKKNGYKEVKMPVKVERKNTLTGKLQLFCDQIKNYKNWNKIFNSFKRNDCVILQFPLVSHCIKIGDVIRKASENGVIVILLVHDLESFRMRNKKQLSYFVRKGLELEEREATKEASYIILHNKRMIDAAEKLGIIKNKLYSIDIFDYLIPNYNEREMEKRKIGFGMPIIIAGGLNKYKAGYIYKLPDNCNFNLFGRGYESQNNNNNNIKYFGVFKPDDLPLNLEGSFGLVWDGPESKTCAGLYGEYLKINNPHKTSLYLASSIPVIVWSGAAIAQFVLENECGIVIDSIKDIENILKNVTEQQYNYYRKNAALIGEKLRNGYYTSSILYEIQKYIDRSV